MLSTEAIDLFTSNAFFEVSRDAKKTHLLCAKLFGRTNSIK